MMNTERWSRSRASPVRLPTRDCWPCRPVAIRLIAINRKPCSLPPGNLSCVLPPVHRTPRPVIADNLRPRTATIPTRHMPRSTTPRRALRGRAKPRRADPQDVAYLHNLADKIRDARAQRGMTRNALAADSGVSLRFLAQLESGQGNPSILVLRRIAAARGFPPDHLLANRPPPAIARIMAVQMRKRVCATDIPHAP